MWHTSATPSLWTCFTPKKMKVCFLVPLKSFGPGVAIMLSVLLEMKEQREMFLVQQKFTLSLHSPWTHPVFALPRKESISIFMDSLMLPCFQAVGSFIQLESYLDLGLSLKTWCSGPCCCAWCAAQSSGMLQLENQAAFLYTTKTLC